MLVSKAMLSVRHAASKNGGRPPLEGIHFRDENTVEATNGSVLIRYTVVTPPTEEFPTVADSCDWMDEKLVPFTLDLPGVETLRKSIPKLPRNGTFSILAHAIVNVSRTNGTTEGKLYAHVTDGSNTQAIEASKTNMEYPATDSVIPDKKDQREVFTLDLQLLELVLKAAKEAGCKNRENRVAATFYVKDSETDQGSLTPVTIELSDPDGGEMLAIVMPMRK